jgi:hypothetical protein
MLKPCKSLDLQGFLFKDSFDVYKNRLEGIKDQEQNLGRNVKIK